MLENQELIISRVINTLNLMVLDQSELLEIPYFKSLFHKYRGTIKRDIVVSLNRQKTSFFQPVLEAIKPLDLTDEDFLLFENKTKLLLRRLTINAMNSCGIINVKQQVDEYIANIEYRIVKNLLATEFERYNFWHKAIFRNRTSKIIFVCNRFEFKLLFR